MSSDKKKHSHHHDHREREAATESSSSPASRGDAGREGDRVAYAEFKILLRPEEMRRLQQAHVLWQHVEQAANQMKVEFTPLPGDPPIRQRDILFYDTPDFLLYENHFILRRRTHYQDGWTRTHDELTFKFRHADEGVVSGIDVHPGISVRSRVKFKREILPETTRVGAIRHIYAKNCIMDMPPLGEAFSAATALEFFPVLASLDVAHETPIALVNRVTVSESLTEFGRINFGHGMEGMVGLALWRDSDSGGPIVAELGFQLRFDALSPAVESTLAHAEEFFRVTQHCIAPWLYLGTTKTNLVYRHGGHEVGNRE